ncbi:sigma-70 family RNA polymerase sigma factor [Proteiniborus sp. MB09-C3]|uniref:RNA polymerase sigma factor n=1 Tax=Proteiniborus sp. MB09-C3 TaxID=3050072 RepID=UPI002555427B|nr:sigma-70 family RNA polymerase sigma factor [Proteiniborus sp. MB09-C3]WIV13505.1 sigma-70 family RNA polymerase sigma factor [Proteiniborus sp. MB09-C3]
MLIYLTLINKESNRTKFEQLYLEYRHTMFYVANSILKDEYLAEDAVHKAFMKTIDHLEKINEIKCHKTKGFLVIIVKNISIDMYNKRKRENRMLLDEISNFSNKSLASEEKLLEDYDYSNLLKKILKLPPNYSNILLLKYAHGYTDEEIADILDISNVNVRKRAERARKVLLKHLEEGSDADE